MPLFIFADGFIRVPTGHNSANIDPGKLPVPRSFNVNPATPNANTWLATHTKLMPVQNSVGAISNSNVPVRLAHTVDKKAVMRGLFQNAKSVGKAAAGLAGKRLWFLMALTQVAPYLAPEGWLYNEDEMEFRK